MRFLSVVALLAVGCQGERSFEQPPDETVLVPRVEPLDDARLLRRMSLDLRGALPTLAELDRVAADPGELDALALEMLDDPRLESRLQELFAEWFRTRVDRFQLVAEDYQYSDEDECRFDRSVGEEPTRLAAHVAVSDVPWSEVVTADYTMANEVLEDIWPVTRLDDGEGWQKAEYTDGRPAGGMLSTNGLWWRYVTSAANANRSRGASLMGLFLCEDLLSRPVSFNSIPRLEDGADQAEVIRSSDACLACHSSLDPLSAALMGFYPVIDYNTDELGLYHPEREALAEAIVGSKPAYFGRPMTGMVDLGPNVANDPRFWSCAAETAATVLWRRRVGLQDKAEVERVRQALVGGDLRFKEALAAVITLPTYRGGHPGQLMTDEEAEVEQLVRLQSPTMMADVVEDLTGFRWTYGTCDQLENDDYGVRTLAGGVDGHLVTSPQADPSLTWALVHKRLAEAAAAHVVAGELSGVGERRMWPSATLEDGPGDPAFEEDLRAVYRRLLARTPTDAEAAGLADLFDAAADLGGQEAAWTALTSVLLRDPEFVSY